MKKKIVEANLFFLKVVEFELKNTKEKSILFSSSSTSLILNATQQKISKKNNNPN